MHLNNASRRDGRDMEPSRFDNLTKVLATATSRRQALKTIAATALGSLLGLSGIGTAFANCKPNGIGCNINSQCCSGGCCHGTCTDLNTTQNCGACGHTCPAEQTCQNGQCCTTAGGTCSGNTDCCSGTCCQGTCCASGQICLSNGTCATTCLGGCGPCPCGSCNCDRNPPLCYTSGALTGCSGDNECPKGQYCDSGYCYVSC